MSDIRSRLNELLHSPRSSSRNAKQSIPALAASTNSRPSTPKPEPKIDDLGFLELASGTDPIVDIVVIHGLDGHRERTWMTEDGILWLRDLLPSDLPNARVLAYGYDADTRSRGCVSTQTIHRHADGLAKALSRKRKEASRRPIIFIAHDLGGIILKQALVICHNQSLESKGELRDILVSTHSILFFGTPHSGISEATTIQAAINRLVSAHMETTDVILKDLGAHSSELENIQRLYIAASEKISSIFFCEEYASFGVGNGRELNVPHHSAVIAGDRNATMIVLHANHRNLVKFSAKENENYQTVVFYLKEYVESAPAAVREKSAREDDYRDVAKGEPHALVQAKARPPVSRSYIERTEIQSLITRSLLPDDGVLRQPRCILYGLGGAGKTQLATNWIREHESSFNRVIVVDASSQAQLEADLERWMRSLGSEYRKSTWKDAVAYLDGKEKGWLLFVDNADPPDLRLDPYLPASIYGTILITTRNGECVGYAPDGAVPVGGLEESEAVTLLHAISNLTPKSDAESLEIVKELGMLALPITQAGTYIRKTRRLDKYLATFRSHRARLMRKQSDLGMDYTSSTYAAFDLSFQQLPAKTQKFLVLFAFLHHSLIPVALFERSVESGYTAYTVVSDCPSPQSDKASISRLEEMLGTTWDEVVFQELVDSASHASFINVSTDGLSYSVHPLFQTYVKDSLDEDGTRRCERTTAQLLLGGIRPVEGSNTHHWQLLPHVNSIPRPVQSENVAHALAFYEFYKSLGNWKPCRELLESALSELLATRGQRDARSIWLMSTLATTLHHCGQLGEAEHMRREVLSLRLDILGGRHPDTISAMNNLAVTLQSRGQFEDAEKMQREVLAWRLDILGERNPDTIASMNNLANTLSLRGQLDEAEKIQREVLKLRLERHVQKNLSASYAMTNLANTLSDLARHYKEAKVRGEALELWRDVPGLQQEVLELQQEVLELRRDVLGERHPDTISAMQNLANALRSVSQLDEAEEMRRKVLALRLDILGGQHPDTIRAMLNLSDTLYHGGHFEEAEKMQREVLDLQGRILGQRHPDTLLTSYSLSLTLTRLEKFQEVIKLLLPTMELRVEVFGKDHPQTRRPEIILEHAITLAL